MQGRAVGQAKHIGVGFCEKGQDLVEEDAEDRGGRAVDLSVEAVEQLLADFWCCQLVSLRQQITHFSKFLWECKGVFFTI